MVRHQRGLAQRTRVLAAEDAALAQRLPYGRLGHPVEVDIVLTDELVDLGIVGTPEIPPGIARQSQIVVQGDGERDGSPEGFGPAPDREPFHTIQHRCLHTPFDGAGDAERDQRLGGAEADLLRGEHGLGRIPLLDGVELDLEAMLTLPRLAEGVGRKALRQG